MNNLEIEYLTPNQYKKYEIELLTIFNENFLKMVACYIQTTF